MIESIEGIITRKTEDRIFIKTASGLGFSVFFLKRNLGRVGEGEIKEIPVHFRVKEDGMELYGFISEKEKSAFRILVGISSIGPKTAMSILDHYSLDEIRQIAHNEDIDSLSLIPGIGKKTASRIILELAGKLVIKDEDLKLGNEFETAKEGLLGMGFEKDYIERKLSALMTASPDLKAAEIIKKVLKDG